MDGLAHEANMATLFGRCVYKGSCELNCQVFVGEDEKAHSTSSLCLACKHLAAFHEQGNLLLVRQLVRHQLKS